MRNHQGPGGVSRFLKCQGAEDADIDNAEFELMRSTIKYVDVEW